MLRLEAAAEMLRRGFGAGATSAGAAGTRYVGINAEGGLRWMIPEEIGAASHVLRDWSPNRPATRLAWGAVRLAARLGFLPLAPRTEVARVQLDDIVWRDFAWTSERAPLVVVYAGTTGAHQKLVCTLVDRVTREARLVVKFPAVDTAKIRIKQEFDALLELASDGCRVSPRPVLLHPELKFSVQSYLAGSSTGPAIQQAHIDFLIGLVNAERRVDLAAVREQLRLRLQQSIAGGLLTNAAQGTLQQLLDKGRWVGSVPAARVHGDFAPWNLKRADDGQIVAVDWEDSAASGLPFLDLHHFQRSVTMRLGRKCTVPWQSYTMALMGADRHLTRDAAEIALVAAGIDHWLSRHWMRGWTEWSI